MGDPRGFLKVKREATQYRPVCERVKDYKDVALLRSDERSQEQGSRCMDCGTPFCHWGCPIGNYIPEWNDLIFRGHWERAMDLLHATNNLPEITGRICPAPCEYACVLGINDDPVTIRENELAIMEHAFRKGVIKPRRITKRTGKSIAIVGSGPAGLSCADQLNKAGHSVTVFEEDDKIGGIMRYGIPDFKLEKWILDRRIKLFEKEGIEFVANVNVGVDFSVARLKREFDATCLAGGASVPRDLEIEGRGLKGIHFAMDYLIQSNRKAAGEKIAQGELISTRDKKVLIIGGGDTGTDCVGTANRQGAACVVEIEVMPKPPECRPDDYPWPKYPLLLKTSTSHEEGAERYWSILAKRFVGEGGHVKKVLCTKAEFQDGGKSACPLMKEIPGSGFEIETDLVVLAIGFLHPEHAGLIRELGVKLDAKGNVATDSNQTTSQKKIFAAGDMRRGQSLIAWAISEGRRAAYCIDRYLMGRTSLPVM